MRINDIKNFFDENVPKKSLYDISWYEVETKIDTVKTIIREHLINSQKESFDFDEVNKEIKTSDTVYFKNNKVIFVEFKSGKLPEKDVRLKATESIISFYNYVFENGFRENLIIPSEIFEICFVYNTTIRSAGALLYYSNLAKKLKNEYKHLYSNIRVIDNNRFQKIFKI